jgi:hypothetical protein
MSIKLVCPRHPLLKWMYQPRKALMYLCVRDVDFVSFYDMYRGVSHFSDSVVFFRTFPTVWYFFVLFRQCGIFSHFSDNVVFVRTFPTVWYFFPLFRQCGIFFAFFRQCGIFSYFSDSVVFFRTFPTVWYFFPLFRVWYFLFFILLNIFLWILIF